VKRSTVVRRYLLFQVPGWIIAAALCVLSTQWPGFSPSTALLLFAAWVGKDLILYPWLRDAYAPVAGGTFRSLVGALGVVERPLDPQGWVRVRGELWRARGRNGVGVLERGARVRVVQVDGMEIVVERH